MLVGLLLVLLARLPEDELVVLDEDSLSIVSAGDGVAVLQMQPAALFAGESGLEIAAAYLHRDGVVGVQNDFALAAFFLAVRDVTPFFLLPSLEKKQGEESLLIF